MSSKKPVIKSPAESRAELQSALQSLDRCLIERAVVVPGEEGDYLNERAVIDRVGLEWRRATSTAAIGKATERMRAAARRLKRFPRL
jgi:hypothetical protein